MLFKEFAFHVDVHPGDAPRLSVLIADDHCLVREGLKLALKDLGQQVQIFEADTVESALHAYRTHPIDLVLLDLSMPGAQGPTALEDFKSTCPGARIVVVSATCDMLTVQTALRNGVLGFIPKRADKAALLNALRFVIDGGIYIPPEALLPSLGPAAAPALPAIERREPLPQPVRPMPETMRSAAPLAAKLTARQIEVLAQMLDGKPNKQICRELNLALGTVKCHVGAILDALHVNSRAEAIAAANQRGLHQWLQPRADSRQTV